MLEKYPQMQSLGGEWQDFKSEFWKDKKESISNAAFAALGVAVYCSPLILKKSYRVIY